MEQKFEDETSRDLPVGAFKALIKGFSNIPINTKIFDSNSANYNC
jgi:hypothetical protein